MTLFEDIVRELNLLNEIATKYDGKIISAINNVQRVRMRYDDGDKTTRNGKYNRVIIPMVYGLKNGSNSPVIRAVEISGSSKRGYNRSDNDRKSQPPHESYYREKPQWKMFRLDRISMWMPEKGKANISQYESIIKDGLNETGSVDDGIHNYFAISPLIPHDGIEMQDSHEPIKSTPIKKSDINPTAKTETETEKQTFEPKTPTQTIDNVPEKEYTANDKINAPETEPIKKTDINPNADVETGGTVDAEEGEETGNTVTNYNDKPITKQDVLNPKDSEFAKKFQDLTNRMDALDKDEDEEENED